MGGLTVNVGEVAPSAAGDQDLASGLPVALEDDDATAASAGNRGAEQTRGARSEHDDIVLRGGRTGAHATPVRPIFGSSSSSTRVISLILRGTRFAFR